MASFRIHEDQENRVPDLRQKQAHVMNTAQQKRSVLGVLDNMKQTDRQLKGKQPLGIVNLKICDENAYNKQNIRKLPPPVVPVAQFEAFNVYEDTKENEIDNKLKERQRKRKDKEANQVYKGTEEDKFVTKKELEEAKRKESEQIAAKLLLQSATTNDSPLSESDIVGSPMRIEKPLQSIKTFIAPESENEIVKSKTSKDLFFEMQEYRCDIYLYLREHEMRNRPKPGYMKKQPDITYNMRTILVDWLVEVAEEYKMQSETLFLAVNYIDRFLSYMSVVRAKLQLVGTAAMFIASKYEEIYPPDVSEFVYITDDTYNKKQVIRMEHLILKVLSFDLSVPTPLTFITAICITNKMAEKLMYLAMYLSELSMLEADPYLESLPSVLAASAIAVARYTLNEEVWNTDLVKSTGYELKDLKKTFLFLNTLFSKASSLPQQAVQEKYKSSRYLHVSLLSSKHSENILQFE